MADRSHGSIVQDRSWSRGQPASDQRRNIAGTRSAHSQRKVTMLSITPCQRMVSDRFPVASFVVHVPPTRLFEIACATDPTLFRGDQRHRRSPENFFTSRGGGLLRAAAGQATYLVPSDALKRFAGRQRLYFALGAYGSVRG